MTRAPRHTPTPKAMHLALAILALVMKVLVPSGFMLSATHAHAGLTPIVLCTAQGEITAYLDHDGQIRASSEDGPAEHDESDPEGHAPCTFAGHTSPVHAPTVLPLTLPVQRPLALDQQGQEASPAPGLGLAAPPPPKTGPPLQV